MSDANKTELTKRVTAAAAYWLGERGFRPVESECTIAERWCADVASFAHLTRTEAKSLRLRFDEIELVCGPITIAVEVKTAVQDFRRDDKFERPNPTHLMYLAVPRNLISLDQINGRWGVLEYDDRTGKIKCIRHAQIQPSPIEQVLRVVVEISNRRDNFTRYERFREFDRQAREHDNERTNRHRLSSVMSAVLAIQSGKYGVDDALKLMLGSKCRLPKWQIDQLNQLATVAADTT